MLMHADTKAQSSVDRTCTVWAGIIQAAEETRDDTQRVQLSMLAANATKNRYECERAFAQLESKIVEASMERDIDSLHKMVGVTDEIEKKIDDGYRARIEEMRASTGRLYQRLSAASKADASDAEA